MVEPEIPRFATTCIYCENLYEPTNPISLNPVCPDCSARNRSAVPINSRAAACPVRGSAVERTR